MTPTVSVVIPCHNAAPFLAETLGSVAAQTQPVDEVVLVDDGSTDGSAEIAHAASQSTGLPLRVIRQPNLGVSAARNAAIAATSGDLIALLDADDLWHPAKIEKQVEYMRRHPDVGTVVTSVAKFTEGTEDTLPFLRVDDAMLWAATPADFLVQTWVNQSAAMVRGALLRATPYPTHTGDSEDMVHAVELRLAAPIGAVPETLAYYRHHAAQATQRSDHYIRSLQTRINWAAANHARLGYASPDDAITPVLEFAAERVLDHYWLRDIPRFKRERDRLLAFWPTEVPVPPLLTRVVLPAFLLRLRDELSSSPKDLSPSANTDLFEATGDEDFGREGIGGRK